ncbi:MAG TPA: tetratricopeptide repeat protein, partial [Bacteroidales bacterium]|nr:tetratricopeptide repeat protein [Bacteroidales bacterium]
AAVYLNTLPNRYAYDDYSVVEGNKFTRQGLVGVFGHLFNDSFTGFTGQKNLFRGGRYRPLSLVTLSIEYQFFGPRPFVSHLLNILLYGLSCMLLYRVLARLFREKTQLKRMRDVFLSPAFLTTLFFALHPIHTEAVANIKGRDEIMALLFSLLAWDAVVRYADEQRIRLAVIGGVYFFLALMSKESAAPMLLLIPASVFCFRGMAALRKSLPASGGALVAGLLLFLLIRQSVLGWSARPSMPDNILSNSFMFAPGLSERYGTTFYTLWLYLKLLLFPHPLTIDYYPFHIPYIALVDLRALLPIVLYAALSATGFLLFFRRHPAGFGILFFLIALFPVSNLPFIVGPFMGERFLFIPSVGFAIITGWGVATLAARGSLRKMISWTATAVLLLYAGRTVARNFDWRDNFSLYTHDVQVSSNSAVANKGAGHEYLLKADEQSDTAVMRKYAREAVRYLERAQQLNRTETETFLLGNAYYKCGDYERAIDWYLETLKISRNYDKALTNIFIAINHLPSPGQKIGRMNQLNAMAGERFETFYQKGLVYGKEMGLLDSSIANLQRACRIDSNRAECLSDLGVALAMKGDFPQSAHVLERSLRLNPGDIRTRQNLATTYLRLGQANKIKALGLR